MTPCAATELEATERQHVECVRQGGERLAARLMIEPAQATEAIRIVREVETHALLLGSDRPIAVLAFGISHNGTTGSDSQLVGYAA